jgi:hypothetical protein
MTFAAEDKLRLKVDDVVWREVGGELVVLELTSSVYLTLNGTAKILWEGLAGGATIDSLVELLTNDYEVTADQARADAESFVLELTERNLLLRGT